MKQTAVEWLIFHWMELDKKYYGGEIGRIDYRNRREAIQKESLSMFEQQISKAWSDGYYKYSGAGDSEAYLDITFEIFKQEE
jgi:hypothetical protein